MRKHIMTLAALLGLVGTVFAGPTRHDQNPMMGEVPAYSVRRDQLLIPWGGFVIDEPRLQFQGWSGRYSYGRAICTGYLVDIDTGREEPRTPPGLNGTVYATRVFRLYKPHYNVTFWNNNLRSMGGWHWTRETITEFFICYTDRGIVALKEMPQKGMRVEKY